MTGRLRCWAIVLGGATLVGCGQPVRNGFVSVHPVALHKSAGRTERIWEAVEGTLRQHRFQLDRVDRRAGVVTTLPVTSQYFFEFWRHDVATRYDFWEATINPIRRWVEVRLRQEGHQGTAMLEVVVHKERLSSPDRQFNSTGAAYQYFGDRLPSTTGLVRVTQEDDRWLDMGRDPAVENLLLRAILKRAGVSVVAEATSSPGSQVPD